jgi:ferredoxin
MATTVRINESCTQCEACLQVITMYQKEWSKAVRSDNKPVSFVIGTDGYDDIEKAQNECPAEGTIEEVG